MRTLVTRRRALMGLLAAPAVIQMAKLMPLSTRATAPVLWQDGVHDDTPWLQYQIDEATRLGRPLRLRSERYWTQSTIIVPRHSDLDFGASTIWYGKQDFVLRVLAGEGPVRISNFIAQPRETVG